MALINRVARLFKADFHAVLDQIEEPELLLKQAVREMEDELAESVIVSSASGSVRTTRKRWQFAKEKSTANSPSSTRNWTFASLHRSMTGSGQEPDQEKARGATPVATPGFETRSR